MKLKFKSGSNIEKVVIAMYERKEAEHAKAVQIIEQETGCKVKPNSELGSRYCFDWRYLWTFKGCYFSEEYTSVPGYKSEQEPNGILHFVVNKRTKIYRLLLERFQKEIRSISSHVLLPFGIKTEGDSRYYGWELIKEDDGTIVMYIHPHIFNLIDFSKSIENGEQTITVE